MGEEVVALVRAVLARPRDQLPQLPRHKPAAEGSGAAVDLMKVLLKLVSEREGVASKVLATVDDLEAIAADDHAAVPALMGWRRELFGEEALKLKRGELALSFDGRRIVALETDASTVRPQRRRGA
jgi:ribonuclease D